QLPPGSYQVTASYSGNDAFAPSQSGPQTLTVTKDPTTTSLKLSTAKVRFGHEQSERFTVGVTLSSSGTLAGKVTIKAGSTRLSPTRRPAGPLSCPPPAKELRPGPYHVTATYGGSPQFASSTSPRKKLIVTS